MITYMDGTTTRKTCIPWWINTNYWNNPIIGCRVYSVDSKGTSGGSLCTKCHPRRVLVL